MKELKSRIKALISFNSAKISKLKIKIEMCEKLGFNAQCYTDSKILHELEAQNEHLYNLSK